MLRVVSHGLRLSRSCLLAGCICVEVRGPRIYVDGPSVEGFPTIAIRFRIHPPQHRVTLRKGSVDSVHEIARASMKSLVHHFLKRATISLMAVTAATSMTTGISA